MAREYPEDLRHTREKAVQDEERLDRVWIFFFMKGGIDQRDRGGPRSWTSRIDQQFEPSRGGSVSHGIVSLGPLWPPGATLGRLLSDSGLKPWPSTGTGTGSRPRSRGEGSPSTTTQLDARSSSVITCQSPNTWSRSRNVTNANVTTHPLPANKPGSRT